MSPGKRKDRVPVGSAVWRSLCDRQHAPAETDTLLDCGDLRGEVAFVTIRLITMHTACLRRLVEHLGNLREKRLGFILAATSDGGTNGLEFSLDAHLHLAVAGSAFDGLTSAFGGGSGIGHIDAISKEKEAETRSGQPLVKYEAMDCFRDCLKTNVSRVSKDRSAFSGLS